MGGQNKTTANTWIIFNGVPNSASEKKYKAGKQNPIVERNRIGTLMAEDKACNGLLVRPTIKPYTMNEKIETRNRVRALCLTSSFL